MKQSFFVPLLLALLTVSTIASNARGELLSELSVKLIANADYRPSKFESIDLTELASGEIEATYTDSIHGNGFANLAYDLTQDASGIVFDFQSNMTRSNTYFAANSVNVVFFANEDMTYELSGGYQMSGSSDFGGISSVVYLTEIDIFPPSGDPPIFTDLLYDSERSIDVPGGTGFTIGLFDEGNQALPAGFGSTSGMIRAGYAYQLVANYSVFDDEPYFDENVTDFHPVDVGGSGSGFVRFTLTPTAVSAVPEPSSMILLGLGLGGIGLASRGRLKRRSADAS